jgi:hypothetical protein
MLKAISLCLAIVSGACAASAQAPATPACRPSLLRALVSAGWAYATNRNPSLASATCPDPAQDPPQAPPAQASQPQFPPNRLTNLAAVEALREARRLFVMPRSRFFSSQKLERELLKHKGFSELELELTRSADRAELILEITRKKFTTRFTCNILEPTTERILAAVTASSLGGEIEPNLADALVKQFKAARAKPDPADKKSE